MRARSVLTFLLLMAFSACAGPARILPETPAPRPAITTQDFPRLDGSTSAEPILATITCEFLQLRCEWMEWLGGERRLVPIFTESMAEFEGPAASGTHQAYLNLISGEVDLILVARPPSAEESALAALHGVALEPEPIALDAFVFIVHEDNPVEGLKTDQIRKIYSGEIVNWNQVGGVHADIHPYQRDDESGSQELMRRLVMRGADMIAAPDMVLPTMMAPFNTISVDPQGIGYSVFYYEENMAPEAERVKTIAVDGTAPDQDTIRAARYPFTTEVYAVKLSKLPKNSLTHQLKDWLASENGRPLIVKSGYVPLR